jgi:ribosomal protein S18 acetylase RimI-like enzyme
LVDTAARGIGLGRRLVDAALDYCRDSGCSSVFLESTDGLPESQALYDDLGFETVSTNVEELWDGVRPLIRMQMQLKKPGSNRT